jgi:hypothetical protein
VQHGVQAGQGCKQVWELYLPQAAREQVRRGGVCCRELSTRCCRSASLLPPRSAVGARIRWRDYCLAHQHHPAASATVFVENQAGPQGSCTCASVAACMHFIC